MKSAESGQRIVLYIVLATIGVSLLVIGLVVAANRVATLPLRLVRLLLTAVLGYFLYRGAGWARWISVVLYGIAAVGSVAGGIQLVSQGYPINGAPLVLMGAIYGASVFALLLVPSVRAHFARDGAA